MDQEDRAFGLSGHELKRPVVRGIEGEVSRDAGRIVSTERECVRRLWVVDQPSAQLGEQPLLEAAVFLERFGRIGAARSELLSQVERVPCLEIGKSPSCQNR